MGEKAGERRVSLSSCRISSDVQRRITLHIVWILSVMAAGRRLRSPLFHRNCVRYWFAFLEDVFYIFFFPEDEGFVWGLWSWAATMESLCLITSAHCCFPYLAKEERYPRVPSLIWPCRRSFYYRFINRAIDITTLTLFCFSISLLDQVWPVLAQSWHRNLWYDPGDPAGHHRTGDLLCPHILLTQGRRIYLSLPHMSKTHS